MSLIQLAYISRSKLGANSLQSRLQLDNMLIFARKNNRMNGITGYLLFDGIEFAQILEGDPAAVMGTFLRISADHRHENVEVLVRGPLLERRFANWDMGLAVREGPLEAAFARIGIEREGGFTRQPLANIVSLAVAATQIPAA